MQTSDQSDKQLDQNQNLTVALNGLLERTDEALALSKADLLLKQTMEAMRKNVSDMIQNVKAGQDPGFSADDGSNEKNFERIVSVSSEAVFECQKGTIRYANSAACAMLGFKTKDDLIGKVFADFIHADYAVLQDDDFAAIIGEPYPVPMKLLCQDGEARDVAMLAVLSPETTDCILLAARDVTDFVNSARDLADQSKRLNSILETTVDAIVVANAKGQIETFNRSAEIMFGYSADEAAELTLFDLLEQSDAARYKETIQPSGARNQGAQLVGVSQEIRARHKKGQIFSAELSLSAFDLDKSRRYTAVLRDITERKQFENYLAHAASHDSLTELPNRRYLDDNLGLIAGDIKDGVYAIWFINLSGFKAINDVMGHAVGDKLLIKAAERMVSFAGPGNVVFRFSGDEFVMLLKGVRSFEDAERRVNRFMGEMSAPIDLQGREAFLWSNIGIALCPHDRPARSVAAGGRGLDGVARTGAGRLPFF